MAYYGRPSLNRGDYYRGDYYRGDPGFFGNVFRAVTRTLGGAVAGLVTGGPLKAIAGAVGGAVSATRANIRQGTLEAGDEGSAYTPQLRAQHAAALARGPVMPGGSMALSTLGPMTMAMPVDGAFGHVRRTHPNRTTYITRGGGTSHWPQQLIVHPKGSELVTSRRMNVGNGRALRRALRRARGFAKLAHRVLRTTRQFKGKGFGGGRRRAKK